MREYEFCSLIEVQGWSDVPRGTRLFEALFAFENWVGDVSLRRAADGLEVEEVGIVEGGTDYQLAVQVGAGPPIAGSLSYDRRRLDDDTVSSLARHYVNLLEGVAASPESRLSELALLSEVERRRLLVEWNATSAEGGQGGTVAELFRQQALRTPEALAAVCEGERVSYGELDRRTEELARYLRGLGVGPEVRVGVLAERSIELVVGVLAVVKAGGAYVPLDPSYPRERLEYMVEDSGVGIVLSQEGLGGGSVRRGFAGGEPGRVIGRVVGVWGRGDLEGGVR